MTIPGSALQIPNRNPCWILKATGGRHTALIPLSYLQELPWYTTRFCTTKPPQLENPRMTLWVWRAPTVWRPAYLLATTRLAHLKGEMQLSREPSVLPPFPWRRVTPPEFPVNVFHPFPKIVPRLFPWQHGHSHKESHYSSRLQSSLLSRGRTSTECHCTAYDP